MPDALPGEYYLRDGLEWVASDQRTLDLNDYNWLGRPELGFVSPSPAVTVNATGVIPLDFVQFEVTTTNTNLWGYIVLDNPPQSSNLSSEPAVLYASGGHLPDGRTGDHTWFNQVEECDLPLDGGPNLTTDDGGQYYLCYAYGPSSSIGGLAIDADAGAMLNLPLAPGVSRQLSTTIAPAVFLQHQTEVHPQATPITVDVSVYPSPGYAGAPEIWASYSGVLFEVEPQAPLADMPLSFGYSDIFPADWVRFVSWSYIFRHPSLLPGTTSGRSNGSITEQRPLAAMPASLSTRLSPPTQFTVDGQSAAPAQTLARLTPRLEWSAPTLGTPNGYQGRIQRLEVNNSVTDRTTVVLFRTPFTHFQVPPGVLSSGGTYMVRLSAIYGPTLDLVHSPRSSDWTIDESRADTMSGIWTAP
ncbi:MAG: hypothetical protein QM723_09120 [Myxococcaceae bacterium]